MAALPHWGDLHPDLLIQIADRLLDLKCYASARSACRSWRRALAPPCPALLVVGEGATMSMSRPSAASLLSHRSFELAAIASGFRCVGSSNGWLALCIRIGTSSGRGFTTTFFLVNPVAGVEIPLPPLLHDSMWISKVVFAPSPTEDDFQAVAISNSDRIVYVTAGARSWAELSSDRITGIGHLTDLVYHDDGKVYCLTMSGDVHILHLPERRRQKPAVTAHHDGIKLSAVRPPEGHITVSPPYYVAAPVTIWRTRRHEDYHSASSAVPSRAKGHQGKRAKGHQGPPDLNAPASLEPLLFAESLGFSPAAAFAPPYGAVSAITNAKHLVLCEGSLYQVWRNTSCDVTLRVPGVGQPRVSLGEVLVLRYYPERDPSWPWDVVKDLGGYSFFVGRNNAVTMYAEGVPGLRGNCVYWIDGHGKDKVMVFDMETGRSTPCRPPAAVSESPGYPRTTCLWYFLSDRVTPTGDSSDEGRTRNNRILR